MSNNFHRAELVLVEFLTHNPPMQEDQIARLRKVKNEFLKTIEEQNKEFTDAEMRTVIRTEYEVMLED